MTATQMGNAGLDLVMPDARARGIFFALCVALPVLITGIALVMVRVQRPAGEVALQDSPLVLAGVIAGVLALSLLLWFGFDRLMRRHRLRLEATRIEIVSSFYRRSLALDELRVAEARVVDLDERTELRPLLKTNAMATPGFRSGWFRLRNREKAFVAMASGPRVLWIPTTAGFGLMLEVGQPQALLERLRSTTDSRGRAR